MVIGDILFCIPSGYGDPMYENGEKVTVVTCYIYNGFLALKRYYTNVVIQIFLKVVNNSTMFLLILFI